MAAPSFHLSLNARDLRGAAAFLEQLLGSSPTQLHGDYARFELTDPPIVLSLVPTDAPAGGLNHLGFRLPHRQALVDLQQRLEAANISFDRQDSIACCHSRQSKFWVTDPSGNAWEFYVLEEVPPCGDEPVSISAVSISPVPVTTERPPAPAVWSHRLGEPLPAQIPAAGGSLDEVVLEGTCNAELELGQLERLFEEVARSLRSGGKLLVRGLTADVPLSQPPRLPGPASAVRRVPTSGELLAAIGAAGFQGLELLTFGEAYRFAHAGAELRETRLQAFRPENSAESTGAKFIGTVTYRGPFAELRDDSGLVFERGRAVAIDRVVWQRLQASGVAEQFVFAAGDSGRGSA